MDVAREEYEKYVDSLCNTERYKTYDIKKVAINGLDHFNDKVLPFDEWYSNLQE